jgi:chemotaxis protein methyltransferase CheR
MLENDLNPAHQQGVANEFEIGIVDTRNIIRAINDIYKYDFTDYALTSFKRRLEYVINKHGFKYADFLVSRLREEPDFFEQFLTEMAIDSTEMFRDPSLWRVLREGFLENLISETQKIKIWIPSCVSGEELFSLAILLKELNLKDRVNIIATCVTEKLINTIKSGYFKLTKLEVSEENYKRANGKLQLSNYFKIINSVPCRDISLIENVTFIKQNINFDNSPQNVKLILFRNQMIYYNSSLQSRIVKTLSNSLTASGSLIIGTKENLAGFSEFSMVGDNESVYKKK